MGTNKNSRSGTAASDAKPPQPPHAPTPHLPFRNANLPRDERGVPPGLLRPIISIPVSPSPKFLIASPELESPTTPTKQTVEAKSNRKKIAILHQEFRLGASGLPITRYPPLITRFLIETPRLEFLVTPRKQNRIEIPNRDKKAIFVSRVRAPLLANRQHDNFQFRRDLAPSQHAV